GPHPARLLASELHLQLGAGAAARPLPLRPPRLSGARAAFLSACTRGRSPGAGVVLHRFPAALRGPGGVRAAARTLLHLGRGHVGAGRPLLPPVPVARAPPPLPRGAGGRGVGGDARRAERLVDAAATRAGGRVGRGRGRRATGAGARTGHAGRTAGRAPATRRPGARGAALTGGGA